MGAAGDLAGRPAAAGGRRPAAVNKFNAKVAATDAVTSSSLPVTLKLTTDWDKKRYPPSKSLVVFETVTRVPSESWVRLSLDGALKSPAGAAAPGKRPAVHDEGRARVLRRRVRLFAGVRSGQSQRHTFARRVKVADFAKALRLTDVTAGAGERGPKHAKPATTTAWGRDDSN